MKDQVQHGTTTAMVLLMIIFTAQVLQYLSSSISSSSISVTHLSRQKRLIFLTSERRLALPVGSSFSITPTLNLILLRNLPTGYGADMLISVPMKVGFDDLGLTSEENPWGLWPDLTLLNGVRRRRDVSSPKPPIDWSDGDRTVLYQLIEDTLQNIGIDGAPCLQRAICEFFQNPLNNHGFFGEMLELIFSASRSLDAKFHLKEYMNAEQIGKTTGNCDIYQHSCSHSLFTNSSEEQIISSPHDRQKRFLYLTRERRLTFPPGTLFFLTLRLNLPGLRTLPLGFGSSMAIVMPIGVNMDALGLTTEEHPFGNFTALDTFFRKKREAGLPVTGINWDGGDREIMYRAVENSLNTIGMNGKACLQRAICEMFQSPLDRHGVLGEALELFFSASQSPYANIRLKEYMAAEKRGRLSGDCLRYHKLCSHSLFFNTKSQSSHHMDIVEPLRTATDAKRRDDIL